MELELELDERLLEELLRLTLEELRLLDEERLPLLTLELFLGEEVLLPPLTVADVPREERDEELLTPLVVLPLIPLGLFAIVEPLKVPESSFFEIGLLTLLPSARVVVELLMPLRSSATVPLTGRVEEPFTLAEPRLVVPLVPVAICVPPLDSSRPPRRSL